MRAGRPTIPYWGMNEGADLVIPRTISGRTEVERSEPAAGTSTGRSRDTPANETGHGHGGHGALAMLACCIALVAFVLLIVSGVI